VLLANPRHRDFYFGLPGTVVTSAGHLARPALSMTTAPVVGVSAMTARGPAPAVAPVRVPSPDGSGRLLVPVSDRPPLRLPFSGVPAGWEMTAFAGDATVDLVRDDGRVAVRLRSARDSFALHRDVVVDLRRFPVLSWSWKVTRLPAGGDVREAGRDDQAAQVYVVFPRWPSPRTSSNVIGYVWDGRAPVGTRLAHPRASNVRVVVLQSGATRLDTWVREQRDVAADYQALFGQPPPRVGKVALMIDSNDTRSEAEALFGDLTFARPGVPQHTDIPTTMLR
jgi:Protein of unknown function (DUF3047)